MKVTMNENFLKLQKRVLDSLEKTDLIRIRDILSSIHGPTLTSGVGGSSVVSLFLSKVLSEKNNSICENVTARDLRYKNIQNFKNIIACSYSGNNFGVSTAFFNELNKYLFSRNTKEGVKNITYSIEDVEESFISLSATLVPMSIVLAYYLDNDLEVIKEILESTIEVDLANKNIYEILSGYDTSVSSTILESTLVESGIGIPIVHDKYEYCHGRSTLGFSNDSHMILFHTGTELDKVYESSLKKQYDSVIQLDKKYEDSIINEYYFTYLSMLLCKKIAEKKEKDLSIVKYSPLVKKLYYFKGEM